MTLFTKKIDEINFADVETFCQKRLPEGLRHDYKQDLTGQEKLAKLVACLANTQGGIILVGVEEEEESLPKLPLRGIPYSDKLHERITSMCVDGIYPSISPEIKIFKIPTDPANVVVLVRVSEFEEQAHSVENGRVYVRTGRQCNPVRDSQELEKLSGKSVKAEESKAKLIERAYNRCKGQRVLPKLDWASTRGVYIVPSTPTKKLVKNYEDLYPIAAKSALRFRRETFPFKIDEGTTSAESVIFSNKGHFFNGFHFRHTEINEHGLIFHVETFPSAEQGNNPVDGLKCLKLLLSSCAFGIVFYENIGYSGNVEIGFELGNIKDKKIWLSGMKRPQHTNDVDRLPGNKINKSVKVTEKISIHDLANNFGPTVSRIFKKFLWDFGVRHQAKDSVINHQKEEEQK